MRDLLLEIGCEELPSSFVDAAIRALPELADKRFAEKRLTFGELRALGTPRRLTLLVKGLAEAQPDLDEEVLGPPARAAFKDGVPTRAAEAFAEKLGVPMSELRTVETPKGAYLAGTRRETGRSALELLPGMLAEIVSAIPFRKSMRWADLDFAFGRPIQWLVALFGSDVVPLTIASKSSGQVTRGHRFLAPESVTVPSPSEYVDTLRKAHVLCDPSERREALRKALLLAAAQAGGTLIEDEFLMDENLSLVEEPHVIVGSFEERFLELPEHVILEVAKGHQRYFGLRDAKGKLMPMYLAVVNTALAPDLIKKGNDRVMRARLADAMFFYREDAKIPLESRREKLGGIVFQKKLGTVLEKVVRIENLVTSLGARLGLDSHTVEVARQGAGLAKCDLVSLMVGEFPELQGEMGSAYARLQGRSPEVAKVIVEHYKPKGASDGMASDDASALVGLADRLDTLVGCFGIGLQPTGTANPFALRRSIIGILRILLDRGFDVPLSELFTLAARQHTALTLPESELVPKVVEFALERLRGVLSERAAPDVVRACLGVKSDRPVEVAARIEALSGHTQEVRMNIGEVFKRASNIAKDAKDGEPKPPPADAHPSERALFDAYSKLSPAGGDFGVLLQEVATIAPVMSQYFLDVFVMSEDLEVRDNRLRLMKAISNRCRRLASFELLASG